MGSRGWAALGQSCGADRPAGLASRKQPGRWPDGSDGRVAFAVGHDGAGQGGDWLGQLEGHAAQAQTNLVVVDLDLLGGHVTDRGEPVFGLEGLVVQQPAGGVPSVLVIQIRATPTAANAGDTTGKTPTVRWTDHPLFARSRGPALRSGTCHALSPSTGSPTGGRKPHDSTHSLLDDVVTLRFGGRRGNSLEVVNVHRNFPRSKSTLKSLQILSLV